MNTEKMKSMLPGVKSKKSTASKQNSSRPVFSSNDIIESFPSYLDGTIKDRDGYLRYILNSGFKNLIKTRTNLLEEYNRDFSYSDLYIKINNQIGIIDCSEEALERKKLALDNLESLLLAKKRYEDLIIENDSKIIDLIDSCISGTGLESQRETLIDDFSTHSYIYSNILRTINIDLSVHIGPEELKAQIAYTMKNTSPKRLRGWYILEKKEQKATGIIKPKLTPIVDEKRISKYSSTYLIIDSNILEKINYHLSFYKGSKELQAQIKHKIPFTALKRNGELRILDEKENLTDYHDKIPSVENQDELKKTEPAKIGLANSKDISTEITPPVKNDIISLPITAETLPKAPQKIDAEIIIEYFRILSNKNDPNRFFEIKTNVESLVYKLIDYGVTDYDHLDYYKDLGLTMCCSKKQFVSIFYSLQAMGALAPNWHKGNKFGKRKFYTLLYKHFPLFKALDEPEETISLASFSNFFDSNDKRIITNWTEKINPEIILAKLIEKTKK